MHAFLIEGDNREAVERLVNSLRVRAFEFPLRKIEEVRALQAFTSLKLAAPTAIVIRNLDEATVPAQNAFLKNLEEPQEGLYYIISAKSQKAVLPTIASRCQVVRPERAVRTTNVKDVVGFLKMDQAEKLATVDKIKKREEALEFTENLLAGVHQLFYRTKDKHLLLAKAAKSASLARHALKANGNVTIQLTNLVIGLV